ncbi:MAG: hypothetical protein CVV02_10730 [Firmicutes bacterium HGW-Firmicutes-7]|nr:MAG: hypothetical protein CVV02_10730 [Firmicutes bacterium HGW-Firmicutes-7]
MLKRLIMIAITICIITKSSIISSAQLIDPTLEQVIDIVNDEFKDKYDFPSDFYNGTYPVSKEIYDNYNILVCSKNGVTRHGNKDLNGEYRFLGYDPYGESIENPDYYYDALDGTDFDTFDWFDYPWDKKAVKDMYAINKSHFDHYSSDFLEIFLYGFNYYHGTNGIYGNHLGPNWKDLPWETYYHIPIAPTQNTRGVAWLFHKESDGSVWYTSAWLPPLHVLEEEESVIVEVELSSEGAVIAHNEKGASTFDVVKGIPTSEQLYVNVLANEYLVELSINKIQGVHKYTEKIFAGNDSNGNPTYTYITTHTPYTYYKIDNFKLYGLADAIVNNYALPNGSVRIEPNSNYYAGPMVAYNQLGGMSTNKSHVTVWNDKLIIDGQVILDSISVSQFAPEPKPVRIPLTHENALYLKDLLIESRLLNKSATPSTTTINYHYIAGIGTGGIKTRIIPTNNVTVHTPVVCDGGILSDNPFDQSLEPDASRAAVILGRPSIIQLKTKGQHINIEGYGNKDYAKYTTDKQVKFPFDVYTDTKVQNNSSYLKSNTWYSVPLDQDTLDIYVPTWVTEGEYTIEYRTIAINAPNHDPAEKDANLNLVNYVATDLSHVKVIGRLYGFRIYDIENYPLWEEVFRVENKSLVHTNNYYSVGLLDENGIPNGNKPILTLPILQGSHPTVINQGALPTGYTFKFECETIGNYSGDKDCIEITPHFYYISADGKTKKEVDLWYSEYFNGKNNYFIQIGSKADEENVKYIKIGDPDRSVSEQEIKDTSKILGITESVFKTQKAKLGWFDRIILAKPLRTFVGNTDSLPSNLTTSFVKKSVQHWYGEYYLPNSLYIAPKGFDVLSYSKANNGLDGKERFWLNKGYVVVNFDLVTVKNGAFDNPVLSYYDSPRSNMWKIEGYQNIKNDYKGVPFHLLDGDIIFYDTDHQATEDYTTEGTH